MSYHISIIGTGNVAYHLAPALEAAGHVVNELYGRTKSHVESIAHKLYSTTAVDSLDFSGSDSKVFILAVSDESIPLVASEIVLPDEAVIIHTSGSVDMSELEVAAAEDYGVLYPLQSFSKQRNIKLEQVPMLVEASTGRALEVITKIAASISRKVITADSDDRTLIHLSAVLVSNFTNHLFDLAQRYMDQNEAEFELLHPLIRETVEKALDNTPSEVQTGPAFRDDQSVIQKHLELLEFNEQYQDVYRVLSESIEKAKK